MNVFLWYLCFYSSKHKHLLMVLLSLEYIVISLYIIVFICLMMYGLELFFLVIFLVFSVCEGALGLSILVSMIRSYGNDFFNYFYYLWYFYVFLMI